MEHSEGIEKPLAPGKPRKRFVGTSKASSRAPRRIANQIPDDILNDPVLDEAISHLPSNYNFEIHKTVHHIRRDGIKTVALQMPEGLMVYGCAIADIIEEFTGALPLLLADVTYGACCIDDFTAKEMGAEMIVHYGHSCLIPVSQTTLKTLYVFVEIGIDTAHLSLSVRKNFPSSRSAFHRMVLESVDAAKMPIAMDDDSPTRLALVSTIQFVASVQTLRTDLESELPSLDETGENALIKREGNVWRGKYDITIPQSKPLSPGEVLGCTAPKLKDVDALIYVGDGRFHLESIMIANPAIPAFRYDPYSKKFTRETYEHQEMRTVRSDAVRAAKRGLESSGPGSWAVVLGTLGRQGSLSVLKTITSSLPSHDPPLLLLLSELSPVKLALFPDLTAFVQTSCPRLSIDWGYAFDRPLLSPYEASVALGRIKSWSDGDYPMDFYSDNSLGPWTPRHKPIMA
ncbi:putative diphthamide synthesis protein-domain-containing protein [Kockovaella imperatae]|uniref:2-(3-amino-3-carboxypropyl)histidine synthase subunit 1 n=1 Tax=Kockovaella imperatae TaxID=4999 RepID=A0A1Y1UV83_9TREE|nr:putative diphthamide synthesis protein-domain-containing protein [Kockovaella imperatae]ORX41125.1 putative diphthamide synthesis protein-domain-containing protein [Kockovaella imperatae]